MSRTSPKPPYPQSPVIESIEWAPAQTIIRLARGKPIGNARFDGSDNWPLAWAEDDWLYTAYGDGYGFDPILDVKLGLGFGRIAGRPGDLTVENIRSDAENTSHGRAGRKASGMLCIDGVLYMLARNADNDGRYSQLAWSTDKARTWTWADWRFEPFGYPTFVNFGRNYAGARDSYVYIVSHNHPDAYVAVDQFILARVPKDRIRHREAYEFVESVGADGHAAWTSDIIKRGPIFESVGQCCRSGISYNAPLKRYLWWQQSRADNADGRFEGGFGVYDAPEPWGPWTTTYFTERWDVGPGETGSFPPKWISPDGKTAHLVFSGDDTFAVRKAFLKVR
jgi:hypothetical protein